MAKHIFIWVFAVLFTAYTIIITRRSNYNMGLLLLWLISLALLCFAIFLVPITAFFAHGIGKIIKWVLAACVLTFAGLLTFVAVSGHPASAQGNEKAIIVLGAGLRGENVSDVLRRRLAAALDEWHKNPAAILVVSGGQGPQEAIPEAVAMQRWLLANGVPEDKIVMEDKSTSTRENFRFSLLLLQKHGITADEPIVFVTNAFHCYRAKQYAILEGYADIRHIPSSMNSLYVLPSYMREVFAVMYFWVFKNKQ